MKVIPQINRSWYRVLDPCLHRRQTSIKEPKWLHYVPPSSRSNTEFAVDGCLKVTAQNLGKDEWMAQAPMYKKYRIYFDSSLSTAQLTLLCLGDSNNGFYSFVWGLHHQIPAVWWSNIQLRVQGHLPRIGSTLNTVRFDLGIYWLVITREVFEAQDVSLRISGQFRFLKVKLGRSLNMFSCDVFRLNY